MIRGDRVSLRPLRRSDIPTLDRWHNDGETMQYWGVRMPLVGDGHWEPHFAPGGKFTKFEHEAFFAICNEGGDPIGRLGLHDYDIIARRGELSIFIAEADYRSKGYGSEAIVAFGHWYFNEKGAHRVWLAVLGTNVRAQRAYEKIGFTREGTWRESVYMNGEWVDEHLYGLLRTEFNARYRPELTSTAL